MPENRAPTPASYETPVGAAVLAALAVLLPVPFIDDLMVGWLRRKLVRAQLLRREIRLEERQTRLLLARPGGCLVGVFLAVVLYPIRKIFRKIFYIFTMKAAADTAARVIVESTLLEISLDRGLISASASDAALARLNLALRFSLVRLDRSPVMSALWGAWRAVKAKARRTSPAEPPQFWEEGFRAHVEGVFTDAYTRAGEIENSSALLLFSSPEMPQGDSVGGDVARGGLDP